MLNCDCIRNFLKQIEKKCSNSSWSAKPVVKKERIKTMMSKKYKEKKKKRMASEKSDVRKLHAHYYRFTNPNSFSPPSLLLLFFVLLRT